MNYLVAIDVENALNRSNTTQLLLLYGLAPYPVRQPIDKGLEKLETLARDLGKQAQRGLES